VTKPLSIDQLGAPSANILRTDSPIVGVLVEQHERRLVAMQHVAEGTRLFRIEGQETETPSRHSLQVGWNLHLDQSCARDPNDRVARFYWRYMNHHCEPTTVIRDRDVVALRHVVPGDGITFDYNTTEYELAEPFECRCGSARCVGVVRGARHLTPAQRVRLEPWLPDYLR
jgi:hypothetical protein